MRPVIVVTRDCTVVMGFAHIDEKQWFMMLFEGLAVQIHKSEKQATVASRRSGAGICVPGVLTMLRPLLVWGVYVTPANHYQITTTANYQSTRARTR